MKRKIKVGSRGSRLALIQAASVMQKIAEIGPGLEMELVKIVTGGDKDKHTSLERISTAVFVKELEEALLEGRIDIAVHSLKDLPTEIPRGLSLLAVTERADPRDVLVAGCGLKELLPGSRIGTGSLRRSVQLRRLRPDLAVCSIRGNIDTRLRKIHAGEADGVIVAAAAMMRLGLENRIKEYLPLEHFLPAVGQGALAVEARSDDPETAHLTAHINHLPTWQSITAERSFLRALGGGCRAPIAALGTVNGTALNLRGMASDTSGGEMLSMFAEGSAGSAEALGADLARKMLDMGAAKFIPGAKGI